MAHGSPIPSFAFRTPAQRNRSLVDQMGAESERQRKMEEEEQRRLQREMQLEIQRQKLREQSEQEDLKSQFQVEQRRQQVLENQDSFLGEFGIEQRRQKSLDQQRAPTPEQTRARRGQVSPDPALAGVRKPGIPSLVEDVFRQTGRVAGGPEEAFLPENIGGLAPPIPAPLVDVETRAARRYAELLEETQRSFPTRTPPGTTIESLALERLEEEFGEEFRAAQQGRKKGPVETLFGETIPGGLLKGVGAGIEFLETKELGGGPFFRDPSTGKTGFETGAEISRPLVRGAQPIVAEPFEQVEAAGIPVVSPVSGAVAKGIESQIVEDIATEIINPAALVLVAPIALQAASGLRGVAAAEALVSTLLATGLEPQLVRGTLRGLTVLGRQGLAGSSKLATAVRDTPIIQDALRGLREAPEAGARPLRGGVDDLAARWREANPVGRKRIEREWLEDRGLEQFKGKWLRQGTDEVVPLQEVNDLLAPLREAGTAPPAGARPLRGGEEAGGFGERFAGRAKKLEGGPPTKRPVTTYEEAKVGLVRFLDEEVKLRKTGVAAAEISTGRKGQFAGVRAGTEAALGAGLRGEEAATAGLRGAAAPEGLRQTVGELSLPPIQKDALFDEGTRLFTSGEILETEFIQATVALKQGFSGRGLQPGQIDIIRKIHGVEVAEKLARRVRPITEAQQLRKAARELSKTLTKTTNTAVRETKKSIATLAKARQAEVLGDFRAARDLMGESIRAATRSDDVIIQETELLLRETREALEGVSPRLAKRADDQITKLRLDMENKFANSGDLVAKAQLIAPDTPELQTVITEWLRINEALLEGVSSEMGGFFAATKAVVTGQLPDSFLSYLSQRRAILATILSRMMPNDPQLVGKITNELMEAELRRRYGADVPQKVRDILAVTKRAPYEEGLGWVETLVQRTKNTMFGIDIGVFMIQGQAALRNGGPPLAAGFVNRMLAAARLPHVAVALADESLPRWSRYLLNGVHQGVSPSAVRAEQGTIFRYLPDISVGPVSLRGVTDVPLSAVTEALNQLQFGVILTGMRNLTFEGNLVMAHLLGRNLQDAKTIATLADSANAITSFAWTALRAGRATAERTLLISPSMTRAQVSRVLQMAKIISPTATATERMVAASMISSWALFTLGVGKLVNDHVGVGEFIFDPTKPGFGLINLRNGRTINLFPQATLVKAIGKSFTAIMEGDPDLAKRAWISMGVGRASVVGSAVGLIFDTGYQPGVGFRVGDLPSTTKSVLLNLAPIPPVIEEVITSGVSAFGIISELAGTSQFETSPFTELRIAWEASRGTRGIPDREFNPETDFAIAEQDSRLAPIVERSRERGVEAGFPSAVAAQERDELRSQLEAEFQLPTLAERVPSDPIAGPAFVDAWFEVQDRMSGAVALDFLGEERNRETPLGQAVLAWQQIRLQDQKYFDRETLRPDRQAYREDKDAAFAEIRQLDPDLASALEQRTPSADPNVKKVEADMLEALDIRRELFDTPKYDGISFDLQEQIRDLDRLVQQARDRLAGQGLDLEKVDSLALYEDVARQNGLKEGIGLIAFTLRPGSKTEKSARGMDYFNFLFENQDLLSIFFPELYSSRAVQAGLRPEIRERVIAGGG